MPVKKPMIAAKPNSQCSCLAELNDDFQSYKFLSSASESLGNMRHGFRSVDKVHRRRIKPGVVVAQGSLLPLGVGALPTMDCHLYT